MITRNEPQLLMIRKWPTEKSTISDFYIEKNWKCFMLEDPVRDMKIPGKTAIDEGTYEVVINYSNRFKTALPLLLNVPNFSGIRIHPGNTPGDTEGCLLPGMERGEDHVAYSRKAFNDIFELLKVMIMHEKVYLKITSA